MHFLAFYESAGWVRAIWHTWELHRGLAAILKKCVSSSPGGKEQTIIYKTLCSFLISHSPYAIISLSLSLSIFRMEGLTVPISLQTVFILVKKLTLLWRELSGTTWWAFTIYLCIYNCLDADEKCMIHIILCISALFKYVHLFQYLVPVL